MKFKLVVEGVASISIVDDVLIRNETDDCLFKTLLETSDHENGCYLKNTTLSAELLSDFPDVIATIYNTRVMSYYQASMICEK